MLAIHQTNFRPTFLQPSKLPTIQFVCPTKTVLHTSNQLFIRPANLPTFLSDQPTSVQLVMSAYFCMFLTNMFPPQKNGFTDADRGCKVPGSTTVNAERKGTLYTRLVYNKRLNAPHRCPFGQMQC